MRDILESPDSDKKPPRTATVKALLAEVGVYKTCKIVIWKDTDYICKTFPLSKTDLDLAWNRNITKKCRFYWGENLGGNIAVQDKEFFDTLDEVFGR